MKGHIDSASWSRFESALPVAEDERAAAGFFYAANARRIPAADTQRLERMSRISYGSKMLGISVITTNSLGTATIAA
jgi:hypothetical protein